MAGYSVTYSVVDNATKQIEAINRRIAAMRAPMERMSRQVQRFVDLSGLNKIARGFEWIGRAAGTVLRTLVEIVPVLGTITGAASLAGMMKLVQSYSNWSQALTSTADSLGVTTQQLQQFQDATRLAGGNADDMTEAMKAFYKVQTDFVRGQASADTIGWLNRLGINVRDANGHLRNMNEIMPEVLQKIADIKNPADRAAASAALLGDGNMKLVEAFRRSHQSFGQWMTDAQRYTELTDKQKDQLQSFAEAQGRLSTAFDHLGQQISATLANNFTPLMNKLSEFVEKHSPEIVAAVDRISQRFADWIKGIDWTQAEQNLNDILKILQTMLKVAEAVGDAVQKTMFLFGMTNRSFTKEDVLNNSPFYAQLTEEQKAQVRQQVGVSDDEYQRRQQPQPGVSFFSDPGKWLGNRLFRSGKGNEGYQMPTGAGPAPSQQSGFGLPTPTPGQAPQLLNALPGDYSWGDYGTRANNPGNMNYSSWQNAAGRFSYTDPQTGGAHTMAVYNTMEEGVADTYKLLARNQAKYGQTLAGALHGWAENSYIPSLAASMGLDPNAKFDIASADPEMVARMMGQQFKREGRRGSHTATQEQILGGINLARGGAPAVPVPSPINGSVDIAITHKNPPPDAAVTARGAGAVNVAPPKVEHQELASV